MNHFVHDPDWGGWIVAYFFLGGLAAGAYFTASLIELAGRDEDRALSRLGYRLAFPLVSACGVLLIVDLYRPERFWHMLVKSEVVREALDTGRPALLLEAPLLKLWSPMSVGSWALLLFGLCSFLSFVGSFRPQGWLHRGAAGRVVQVAGCAVGFFVAAYTGSLLTATNQPLWADSTWIAPLFLASAASTGIAALLLLAHRWRVAPATRTRLERADRWALGLELAVFVVFVASLGRQVGPILETFPGKLLVVAVPLTGLLVPLLLARRHAVAAATFALLGGLLLRYAILATPPRLLAHGPSATTAPPEVGTPAGLGAFSGFSREDGRPRGGGPGADPGNHGDRSQPRSKFAAED